MSDRKRRWYERNRSKSNASKLRCLRKIRAQLDAIKLESGCVDCGYNGNPVALDFDHVRGEKLGTVANIMTSWSIYRILAEVAKCDIRCANCHRIKSHEERLMKAERE